MVEDIHDVLDKKKPYSNFSTNHDNSVYDHNNEVLEYTNEFRTLYIRANFGVSGIQKCGGGCDNSCQKIFQSRLDRLDPGVDIISIIQKSSGWACRKDENLDSKI